MTDEFSLFSDSQSSPPIPNAPSPMTDQQRGSIRDSFGQLGIAQAKEQFAIVEELLGQRIHSVGELDGKQAAALMILLRAKVETSRKQRTGNSWDDRDEPTWIDNL